MPRQNTTGGARKQDAAARFAEIERRLREAMDKPKPTIKLSHDGRVAVKRMVTKLANIAGTRRLKSHSETFARAAAKLELVGEHLGDHTADLAVSTLECWLNGYKDEQKRRPSTERPARPEVPFTQLRIKDDDHGWRFIGVPAGSVVSIAPTPTRSRDKSSSRTGTRAEPKTASSGAAGASSASSLSRTTRTARQPPASRLRKRTGKGDAASRLTSSPPGRRSP
jgi:hypothetical protein